MPTRAAGPKPAPAHRSERGSMNSFAQPCAVVMELEDDEVVEQVFATRFQAEIFVYLLPYAMSTLPDGRRVKSAILSPLEEAPPAKLDICR